jgi:hypothetical protein
MNEELSICPRDEVQLQEVVNVDSFQKAINWAKASVIGAGVAYASEYFGWGITGWAVAGAVGAWVMTCKEALKSERKV